MEKQIEKECKHHGLTKYSLEARGSYRCMKCRSERVSKHRRKLKEKALQLLGNKCSRCNYDKSSWSLEFHHIENKEYVIGHLISQRKEALLFEELKKCILLCANCHGEVEEQKYLMAI